MKRRVFVILLAACLAGCTHLPTDLSPPTEPERGASTSGRVDDDLRVSGPHTFRNLEVYLIHGADRVAAGTRVIGIAEAIRGGHAVVHETGSVNQLAIENLSPSLHLFAQSGDIVQGGKQDRVLAVDLLLPPGSGRQPLAAYCVEQGRWHARRGDVAPTPVMASAPPRRRARDELPLHLWILSFFEDAVEWVRSLGSICDGLAAVPMGSGVVQQGSRGYP